MLQVKSTEQMADHQDILPKLIEEMIIKTCQAKQQDPPDSWARQRLAAVGESVAAEILSRIYNQKTQVRDLSRLIVWMVDNPQSPIRVPVQQDGHSPISLPQSPISSPQSPPNCRGSATSAQSTYKYLYRITVTLSFYEAMHLLKTPKNVF